jgi:hypothetical protein
MAYELRALRRQKVRYNDDNDDNKLAYQLLYNGEKVTPSGAAITIYAPTSTTAILSATAMTLSGSLLTYAVDTTTTATWPQQTGYRARIAITYAGTVYLHDKFFDVSKNLLTITVSRDQLLSEDRNIAGMEWDGDEDFKGPISAALDELQADIESQVLDGATLTEGMIPDESRMAIPLRYLALAKIYNGHGNNEMRDYYEKKYEEKLRKVLATLNFDANEDQVEDSREGGAGPVRLAP